MNDELWLTWVNVVGDWTSYKDKKDDYIRDLVRRGVPANQRAAIWKLLANAQATQDLLEKYKEALKKQSPCEKLIQRDIARTYPSVDYFKDESGPGQEGLFNVIKAYSVYDQEVGYCQGSAFIVGLLLMQLSEEDTFVMLCKIMKEYKMREIYKPTMADLGLCIYQLECLVQELIPELHVHFVSQNFHTSMYSSSWFCTLFTSYLPIDMAYRVMDLFLSEGIEMVFRLSIAILMICKEDLLKLDMEGLLKYFREDIIPRLEIEPEYLVQLACQVKYDAKKLKKMCKDYTTMKTKEQEEMVELRRLRTENRLLRQRLDSLETESAELAEQLIKGQVCKAQVSEENDIIRGDLSRLQQAEKEYKTTIAKLEVKIAELETLLKERTINYSQEAQNVIQDIQEELVAVKLREAENHVEIKTLQEKVEELEAINKSLREREPEDPVAQLQDELIAVKLREAEANLAMKELRRKIQDLQAMWQEHMQQAHSSAGSGDGQSSQPNSLEPTSSNSNSIGTTGSFYSNSGVSNNNKVGTNLTGASQPSSLTSVTSSPLKFIGNAVKRNSDQSSEIARLKQELLTFNMRDADSSAEIKELRLRTMELEAQNQVQLNQIRRQADELSRTKKEIQIEKDKQLELQNQIREERRKCSDLDFKFKEDNITRRIKDMEHTHKTAELTQKISSLEAKIEELITAKKLSESGDEPKDAQELQDRMAELQTEMFRLDVNKSKLSAFNS
ncbi:Ecotropic viral integration site 5 ortholog-like, partial [Fragariocoptes setiger]